MAFDNQMPGARASADSEIVTVERRCFDCGRRGRFRQRWPVRAPAGFVAPGPDCADCGGRTVSWPLG